MTLSSPMAWAQTPGTAADAWTAYDAGKYAEALKIAQPLAEKGDAEAQAIMGLLYEFGDGVIADRAVAAQWYKKGADAGNTTAALGYGYLNYAGDGVPQDFNTALIYFLLASSDQGEAAYFLGRMYEDGSGVDKDQDAAISWYQTAANLGYEDANDALDRLGALPSDGNSGSSVAPVLNEAFLRCKSMFGDWTWFSGGHVTINDDGTMSYTSSNGLLKLTRTWECTDGDGEKAAAAVINWNKMSGELFSFDPGYVQEIAMSSDSSALYEGSSFTNIKSRDPLATR